MLHQFLRDNEEEILAITEKKTRDLAGDGPSSAQLKKGLPIFYRQLITVLKLAQPATEEAAGHPGEIALAHSAATHGIELLRLGYTLSHVVHAYGALCQSITELTTREGTPITSSEFHDLNQCLDVAIAGAVTAFEAQRRSEKASQEIEHLGLLAHELRNALSSVTISHQLIKNGMVSADGSTNRVLEAGLKRLEQLIDRSLTEVRLRVDPKIYVESARVSQLVDQIVLTAVVEARAREQTLDVQIDAALTLEVDQQLLHSALSNLIQNALKYTHVGGRIQIRARAAGEQVVIEVEDECGGLPAGAVDLFKPYEQQHANRTGLGLGLAIAQRAIALNHGAIEARDLPGKGCVFSVTLPRKASPGKLRAEPAA